MSEIDLRPWRFHEQQGMLVRSCPGDDESTQVANTHLGYFSEVQVVGLLRRERERCACTIIQYDLPAYVAEAIRSLPDTDV